MGVGHCVRGLDDIERLMHSVEFWPSIFVTCHQLNGLKGFRSYILDDLVPWASPTNILLHNQSGRV